MKTKVKRNVAARVCQIDRVRKMRPKTRSENKFVCQQIVRKTLRSKIRSAFISSHISRLKSYHKKLETIIGFEPVPLPIERLAENQSKAQISSTTKFSECKTGNFVVRRICRRKKGEIRLDTEHEFQVMNARASGFWGFCHKRYNCPRFNTHYNGNEQYVIKKILSQLYLENSVN